MKRILTFSILVLFTFSSQSMQQLMQEKPSRKAMKTMLLTVIAKHEKEKSIDIEEREACASTFVENIDNVVWQNGFNSKERQALEETNNSLRESVVQDDEIFIRFYKTARFANVLLRKIASKQTKTLQTLLEQHFILGKLSTLAAKIKADRLDEEFIKETMSQHYFVNPHQRVRIRSPFATKFTKASKKVRIQEPEDLTPTFILTEVPKAQFKTFLPTQDKSLEEGIE